METPSVEQQQQQQQAPENHQQASGGTQPPKLASAGKPVPFSAASPAQQQAPAQQQQQATAGTEDLTEDQLKAFFEKQGIKYESLDKLKEKANYEPPVVPVPPTQEELDAIAKANDKKMLDFYVENGGTPEQYVAIKNLLSSDLTQVSIEEIKKEMKEDGFNDEEIASVISERYYQLNPDEIEQGQDESDEDYQARVELAKKKVAYGSKKLEARNTRIKAQAEGVLNGLKKAIEDKENSVKEEEKFKSNVDKTLASLPRKITFELGKVNDLEISPVEHEISEESIAKVADILKDPAKRNQFLFNQDDSLNIDNIAKLMLRNEELERAVKGSLLEGQTRQVKIFRETFPSSPQAVGVGGTSKTNSGVPGRLVSAGKPQPVRRG